MTSPTVNLDAEYADGFTGTARGKASPAGVEVVEFPNLAEPCRNCTSRGRCLASRLMMSTEGQVAQGFKQAHAVAQGEHLFREGDRPDALYVVRSGSAKVYFVAAEGSEQVVGFYMPGDVLGLDALGVQAHASSAVALESTSVCVIPFSRLDEVCAQSAERHRCLYKLLSSELIRDQRTMELINKKDAEAKMAGFLVNLSERFRARGYSASSFNLSMKRNEIGNHLGLAVETVSRIFTRFQDDGLLHVERRRVQIRDREALEIVAGCRNSH